MPILASNIQKARYPMPPVEISLFVEGVERKETIRLSRRVISPASRAQFKETFEKVAPEKDEIIRAIVYCEVESPDIVDAEGKPTPLDADLLDGFDESVLHAMFQSLQESRIPNGTTSVSTSSG